MYNSELLPWQGVITYLNQCHCTVWVYYLIQRGHVITPWEY